MERFIAIADFSHVDPYQSLIYEIIDQILVKLEIRGLYMTLIGHFDF
jgi:hypothetical protein